MTRSFLSRLLAFGRHLTGFARRAPMDARLAEEVRFHIEMHTERSLRLGMTPAQARHAALLTFGGAERWKESSRDEYRSRPLEDFVTDLTFALRTLRSAPAFTLAAVL